ncbi:MAG: polysaccharide biosynthesis protein [Acidobacteriaceae bacterium]
MARAAGRCVLVTGAGGFIGAEMVRRLAASGAGRMVLLDAAEQPLFRIHADMMREGYGDRCAPVLGSVCDAALLRGLFEEHRPEMVLHAAALKHVPLMERNPVAAVETNALGTWRVAKAAAAHGARAMVLVSTDKAVAPHSIMGAAKRIAELVMLDEAGAMRCAAVRLANVIGSPGSVGPLFEEQLLRGEPMTVTHPEAKRYFLTLAEVAALLAQAMDSDAAEGVLIPDPGEPVRIVDLARRMMAAAGRLETIAMVGLRPGDKLDESLMGADERDGGPATRDLRRVQCSVPANLEPRLRDVETAMAGRDVAALLRVTMDLVPGYEPSAVLREAVLRQSVAEMAQP